MVLTVLGSWGMPCHLYNHFLPINPCLSINLLWLIPRIRKPGSEIYVWHFKGNLQTTSNQLDYHMVLFCSLWAMQAGENTWNLPSWPVMRRAGLAGTHITNNSNNPDVPGVLGLLLTLLLWRQRPPTLNSVPSGTPFCHLISHIDAENWPIGKDPDAGKDWRQEEKGMTEDEVVE